MKSTKPFLNVSVALAALFLISTNVAAMEPRTDVKTSYMLLSIANQSDQEINALVTDLISVQPYEDTDYVIPVSSAPIIYTKNGTFRLTLDNIDNPMNFRLLNDNGTIIQRIPHHYDVNNIIVIINPDNSVSIAQGGNPADAIEKINTFQQQQVHTTTDAQLLSARTIQKARKPLPQPQEKIRTTNGQLSNQSQIAQQHPQTNTQPIKQSQLDNSQIFQSQSRDHRDKSKKHIAEQQQIPTNTKKGWKNKLRKMTKSPIQQQQPEQPSRQSPSQEQQIHTNTNTQYTQQSQLGNSQIFQTDIGAQMAQIELFYIIREPQSKLVLKEWIKDSVRRGVDINQKGNPDGKGMQTPLDYALSLGRSDAVEILMQYGAKTSQQLEKEAKK